MGSEIRLECASTGGIAVMADRQRIQQVFSNLVQNALQSMPTGGRVSLVVEDGPRHVSVRVSDQGRGFSRTALARAGEPFYSEREGGMGLGLAVAIDICRAHQGTLQVENLREGGACIRVELAKFKPQDGPCP